MDIEAFSDDNFDAATWINTTFKNSDQQDNKEVFVSSLVSKLQLYVQQVNSALEDTSQQVLAGLPRVMKDAQNLQAEAVSLRAEMTEVQTEIRRVQDETGDCMANLERLDSLKTKLQLAKQGLQESDGWGKLIAELEDLFERNDLLKICEKLDSLQKSLAAQDGLPGQSERESQVEGFKNRLEALASPAVVQCFTAGDMEEAKKYVKIFSSMNRLPQLTQYYRTVQKTALQQHWNEILDLSENSNRFLHDFYEYLAESYQKQFKWCIHVFGQQKSNESILILIELLSSLQPTRESTILGALKRSNDKLDLLQEFSSANIYFGHLLQKQFELGTRLPPETGAKLSKVVFNYFNTFINQYPAIEQNWLAANLTTINPSQTTAMETIRTLGNANRKVIEWCEECLKRCESITQNCAIVALSTVFNFTLKQFIEKYKKAQKQLSFSRNVEQNWSLLQHCMSLLQNLGDFQIALKQLEKQLTGEILETSSTLEALDSDYFGYRIVEKRDKNELKKCVAKIKENQQRELLAQDADNESSGILASVFDAIQPIFTETHDTTLAAVFAPIEKHLETIEPSEILNASGGELPDYSFAPQEFITQIGQYLLTLPQHLEPLLLSPSATLKIALEACDKKYSRNIPSADVLLSLVVEECCAMYQSQILHIKSLSTAGAKQIATDIEYLGSVLEELGLNLSGHLQQTAALLRAPADSYLSLSSGCEPRLVTAVRQMREIISTE